MKLKNIFQIIIFLLLGLPMVTFGSQEKEFDYEFIKEDTYYSFRGSFLINAESDCLIDLIYNFNNISDYSSGAQSIELIQQGDNWYEVSYTCRKLFVLENKSTWRRILKKDEQKIVFEMLSSENNLMIMPQLISSTGYYLVKEEKGLYRVEYFQESVFKPKFFNRAYVAEAKKEAIAFLHEFKQYLERKCG